MKKLINTCVPELIDIPLHTDDRGYVYCVKDLMDEYGIKRIYVVENFEKGRIRAWHGHRKGHTFMHVIQGAVKLAALNMDIEEDDFTAVCTERKPQLFFVPAGYYNGALSLTDKTKILVMSTLSFDEVKQDDIREHYTVRNDIWQVENR